MLAGRQLGSSCCTRDGLLRTCIRKIQPKMLRRRSGWTRTETALCADIGWSDPFVAASPAGVACPLPAVWIALGHAWLAVILEAQLLHRREGVRIISLAEPFMALVAL
jgi:hypothetical protein